MTRAAITRIFDSDHYTACSSNQIVVSLLRLLLVLLMASVAVEAGELNTNEKKVVIDTLNNVGSELYGSVCPTPLQSNADEAQIEERLVLFEELVYGNNAQFLDKFRRDYPTVVKRVLRLRIEIEG
jgi:hypothetical protein